VACLAGVVLVVLAFPALARFDAHDHLHPATGAA
jgi:hypothetical protein